MTTTTTTTILVHTSAASAVRHSCQHGWHRVDLDTSELTEEQRELLAERVDEDQGARYQRRVAGSRSEPYDVAPPTVAGLVASLDEGIESWRAEQGRRAEREAAAAIERSISHGEIVTIIIDGSGAREALMRELHAYCDGSVETNDDKNTVEYWGIQEDDDDAREWRVHIRD